MANKVKDPRYDITGELPETEDELFSTDFEMDDMAPQDAELYQRYKMMSYRTKHEEKVIDEQMEIFAASIRAHHEGDITNATSLRPFWEIKEELMDKHFARRTFNAEIENHLAQLRFHNAIDKLDPVRLTQDKMGKPDAEFGIESGFEPFNRISDATKADPNLPMELRKFINRSEPELQNIYNPVFDEISRQQYVETNELKTKLFEAKWNWYKEKTYGSLSSTTHELEEEREIADDHDRWMKNRVEFMYDYLDFDNDRSIVRHRFLKEMHKKSSMQEIGEKLDEFILTSKAAIADYWDIGLHTLEEPHSPQNDFDQTDFDWHANIIKSFDPK